MQTFLSNYDYEQDLPPSHRKHGDSGVIVNVDQVRSRNREDALSSGSEDVLEHYHLNHPDRAEGGQVCCEWSPLSYKTTSGHTPVGAATPPLDRNSSLRRLRASQIESFPPDSREQTSLFTDQLKVVSQAPEKINQASLHEFGGHSRSHNSSCWQREPFQSDRVPRPEGMRTVPYEDYLTARAANPHTGVITPSIHSDSTPNAQISKPVAKWRRVGDEWVSIAVGQPTPEISPTSSSSNLHGRVAPCGEHSLRTPRLSPRNGVKTRHAKGQSLGSSISNHDYLVNKAYDKQYPQSAPPARDNNNIATNFERIDRDAVRCSSGSNQAPMTIPRKAVGSLPSDLKVKRRYFGGATSTHSDDLLPGPVTEDLSRDQHRSTSAPKQMPRTYFSPDDVGKDLSNREVSRMSSPQTQPREHFSRPEPFLGLRPGDFFEDVPIQFQIPRVSPQLGKPLPALPMSNGPFHSLASTAHNRMTRRQSLTPHHLAKSRCSTGQRPCHWQKMPWPETSSVERTPLTSNSYHLGRNIGANVQHERVVRSGDSSRSYSPPCKMVPHHSRTDQSLNPFQDTNVENWSSKIHQDGISGKMVSQRESERRSNKTRTGQPTSAAEAMSTNIHIFTITTMQGQRENVCQLTAMPPGSAIKAKDQGQPMPTLKRQDGSGHAPRMSSLANSDKMMTNRSLEKVNANADYAALSDENLNLVLTPQASGVDGATAFGSGLTTANPYPTTNRSNLSENICKHRLQPVAKQSDTGGSIPMSENPAAAAPQASSHIVLRKVDRKGENERQSRNIASEMAALQSPNTLPNHEQCCPICCGQGFHDSCQGHRSSPSATPHIPNILKPVGGRPQARRQRAQEDVRSSESNSSTFSSRLEDLGTSVANSIRLRRSFRTRMHETDRGSFTETESEEVAELKTPARCDNDEDDDRGPLLSMGPGGRNEKRSPADVHVRAIRRYSSTSSSASLRTLHMPTLLSLSIIDAVLVPLNVAMLWCKSHPEFLSLTITVLSRVGAMVMHVLGVCVEWYEVLAEYGHSGKVRCKRGDGWGMIREGGVVVIEMAVIMGMGMAVLRVVGLVFAVGRVVWAVGRGLCWVLGLGFGVGAW